MATTAQGVGDAPVVAWPKTFVALSLCVATSTQSMVLHRARPFAFTAGEPRHGSISAASALVALAQSLGLSTNHARGSVVDPALDAL